jgi:hypothetical protein
MVHGCTEPGRSQNIPIGTPAEPPDLASQIVPNGYLRPGPAPALVTERDLTSGQRVSWVPALGRAIETAA